MKNKIPIINWDEMEKLLHQVDGKIRVINFWATWCKPCVEELPAFEKLQAKYPEIEVLLISLDFEEKQLKNFVKQNNIKSKVLLLDAGDPNSWIEKVDKNWDGAIPVTLIYKNKKRQFYKQDFTLESLESVLKEHFI